MVSRDDRYTETGFLSLCCGCIQFGWMFRWQIMNSYWKRRIKTTHIDDFCSSIRKSPTVALIMSASVCRDIHTHKLSRVFKIFFKRNLTVRSTVSIYSRFCYFHKQRVDLRSDESTLFWFGGNDWSGIVWSIRLRLLVFDGFRELSVQWIFQNAERRDGGSFSIYFSFIDFYVTIPLSSSFAPNHKLQNTD